MLTSDDRFILDTLRVPNPETIEALEQARTRQRLVSYTTIEDLFEDIGNDEDRWGNQAIETRRQADTAETVERPTMTASAPLDTYFAGYDEARLIFDTLRTTIEAIGPAELRVTKSQVAFRRRTAFAWARIPGKYLHGQTAPLVLTLALRRHDTSPRWKEIVEPAPGRFTHHLELFTAADIDDLVLTWLHEAWELAT